MMTIGGTRNLEVEFDGQLEQVDVYIGPTSVQQ